MDVENMETLSYKRQIRNNCKISVFTLKVNSNTTNVCTHLGLQFTNNKNKL